MLLPSSASSSASSIIGLRSRLMTIPIYVVSIILVCNPFFSYAQTATSSFNERVLGQTEGCFNTFSYLLSIYFPDTDILSNAKCQSTCANHGFVTAATSQRTCFCGNIYPAVYYRVDDRRCSNPCSQDRATCSFSACCGDALGTYFTVSFAGEIEPRLELLRRLTYDYRQNSPIFQDYIEGLMSQTTALQALRSGPSPAMAASTSSTLGNTSMVGVDTGFVGVGEGCPTGWQTSGDSCYFATIKGT